MIRRFRSTEMPTLHYYLYISDSKLDMLYEQIDQKSARRISAELKVDLKLASLTIREASAPDPTRDTNCALSNDSSIATNRWEASNLLAVNIFAADFACSGAGLKTAPEYGFREETANVT